jgi:hypothetical protein
VTSLGFSPDCRRHVYRLSVATWNCKTLGTSLKFMVSISNLETPKQNTPTPKINSEGGWAIACQNTCMNSKAFSRTVILHNIILSS